MCVMYVFRDSHNFQKDQSAIYVSIRTIAGLVADLIC